ncbi:TPA: hypothetical protein ACH3X2_008342 [Trebouxia sp. C0005]
MDATLTQNLGQLSIIDAGLQTPPTQSFSHGEANGSMDEDQLRNANEYIAELKKKLHCFGVTGNLSPILDQLQELQGSFGQLQSELDKEWHAPQPKLSGISNFIREDCKWTLEQGRLLLSLQHHILPPFSERDAQAVVLKQQIVQARGNLVRGSQRLCEVLDYMAWKLKQLENQLKQLSLTGCPISANQLLEQRLAPVSFVGSRTCSVQLLHPDEVQRWDVAADVRAFQTELADSELPWSFTPQAVMQAQQQSKSLSVHNEAGINHFVKLVLTEVLALLKALPAFVQRLDNQQVKRFQDVLWQPEQPITALQEHEVNNLVAQSLAAATAKNAWVNKKIAADCAYKKSKAAKSPFTGEGKADFALKDQGDRVYIACENKHPGCLSLDVYESAPELVNMYTAGQRWKYTNAHSVVAQQYNYMIRTDSHVGIISTFNTWWLVQRTGHILKISDAIDWHSDVGVFAAVAYCVKLAFIDMPVPDPQNGILIIDD